MLHGTTSQPHNDYQKEYEDGGKHASSTLHTTQETLTLIRTNLVAWQYLASTKAHIEWPAADKTPVTWEDSVGLLIEDATTAPSVL